MEVASLLLPISDLSLDEPTRMSKLVENMVMVDHDLNEGVISSLYPENGDTTGEINLSTTEEPPSYALLETTPEGEEPQISIVNLYSPIKEGTEPVESEPEPCLGQFTSNKPEEEFQSVTVWGLDLIFSLSHLSLLFSNSPFTFTISTMFFADTYQYIIW